MGNPWGSERLEMVAIGTPQGTEMMMKRSSLIFSGFL